MTTLERTSETLMQLKALRQLFVDKKPGYDQKARCKIIELRYGDDERFLETVISEYEEALYWHRVQVLDEE